MITVGEMRDKSDPTIQASLDEVTPAFFQWKERQKQKHNREDAVARIKRLAPKTEQFIQVDALADLARELGVWGRCREAIDQANRRVLDSYSWAGMQKGRRRVLVVNGYEQRYGRHVRRLEATGWTRYKVKGNSHG